jgi:transposase
MRSDEGGAGSKITAHLLGERLKETTVDRMIVWISAPRHMRVITFGMRRGTAWSALPIDYLQWMVQQATMDADDGWHARQELARRA